MISDQARQYLRENLPVDNTLPPPSPDNISEARRQSVNDCQPAIEAIRLELQPHVQDIEIAGIPCLEVLPRNGIDRCSDVVLVYLYGGGYIQGSPEEDLPVSAVLADLLGLRVVCPRYRLAPEYPYPAAIEDGMAVYRYIASQYSPGRVIVCGESAGGNLATQLIIRGADEHLAIASRLGPAVSLG